ncbi:hypothetical protein NQ318_009905 [Aromia moschata]|uniref:N-acetyltransferase domain-containing protein n=1 Tax=Aromia moschata TaxID=1265417 RepID=A0AAV8Y3J4_9CUCU|nr:hypothetical protein NQ318_009905 [Aromia moschata]
MLLKPRRLLQSQSSVDTMSSCPSTPSTPTSPVDYEISVATEADREDIRKFLQTFFFRDEPLNSYLELINDERPTCKELEDFSLKELDNGFNLKATHNGKLIGVSLNGILERGWLDRDPAYFWCNDEKFNLILALLGYVTRQADTFNAFPGCDKAMTVKILSVDSAYRGKGLAKALMSRTSQHLSNNILGLVNWSAAEIKKCQPRPFREVAKLATQPLSVPECAHWQWHIDRIKLQFGHSKES